MTRSSSPARASARWKAVRSASNITQRQIEVLPQNNRNFLAFADLAPGVQFVTGGNQQSRLQGGAQDSRSVNIFIDGVGQKDYVLKNGITGQDSTQGNPFPQLAVGEYRVISSNYKAEFDQVSSVAITAVTKSGTNEFHGEAFIDYTDQSFRDRRPNELTGTKIKTKDFQFGGALGGPIIKDMLHFFVTYEGKRQQNPVDVTPGLSLPVSYFPSEYQGVFGPTNATFNEDLYFGKLSFQPSNSDLIELSGKYRKETGEFLGSGISARSTHQLARMSRKSAAPRAGNIPPTTGSTISSSPMRMLNGRRRRLNSAMVSCSLMLDRRRPTRNPASSCVATFCGSVVAATIRKRARRVGASRTTSPGPDWKVTRSRSAPRRNGSSSIRSSSTLSTPSIPITPRSTRAAGRLTMTSPIASSSAPRRATATRSSIPRISSSVSTCRTTGKSPIG